MCLLESHLIILFNDSLSKLAIQVQTLIAAGEMNINYRTEKLRTLRRELVPSGLQLFCNG